MAAPFSINLAAGSTQPASALDDPLLLAEWFLVAWSSEVPLGHTHATRLIGRDLVLWRSSKGVHCWLDLCVHRGAKLSLGRVLLGDATTSEPPAYQAHQPADCLVCPYHAWHYATTGECVHIPAHPTLQPPAKAHAQVFRAREKFGAIWVCLGNPVGDLPEFAAAETEGFRTIPAGPYHFHALGPRLIENALDVAHLGYVHQGLLGDPSRLEIEDYEVTEGAHGPEANRIRIWQPNPDGTGHGALITYRYWIAGPLTIGFEKTPPEDGSDRRSFSVLAQVAPVDAEHSEMRMLMSMNYGHDIPDGELRSFQDKVTEQDRVVVESQRPELLPLDLQAELHLRSDRMAIAYRKWLRKIGLRYGAS